MVSQPGASTEKLALALLQILPKKIVFSTSSENATKQASRARMSKSLERACARAVARIPCKKGDEVQTSAPSRAHA
eukprot:6639110-Pyramimonas_sp.AAC.1